MDAYNGGVNLKDLQGRIVGGFDIRGGDTAVTVTMTAIGEVGYGQATVDFFHDADVEDAIAALRLALERKRAMQMAAGGPV